ncbi:hypothetical protein P8452_72008 [Trifolium repens]|nr:hypothetical protein P8452_72008 [Trifolium repens]
MEEKYQIQELKHACKYCNKSFPCGRSLGGHMRSHINNLSSEKTELKQKVSIKINNGSCIDHSEATAYGLRENPKKTWRKRVAESSEEDSYVYDKFCKECGKCFQSWKALFGHMKCHSDQKERVSDSLEDQDSWTNNAKDVQSDNEITAPRRKRRSKRTRTRYNNMVGSSTAATATTSSSVSEVEHEQEEVAISLIMLSRDVSPWSGLAESSDNNSVYFEARSSVRTNLVTKFDAKNKNSTTTAAAAAAAATINIAKLMKQNENKKCELGKSVSKKLNFKGKSLEILDTEKGFKMNKSGVSIKGFLKATKSELDYVSTLEESEVENGKSRVNGTESAMNMSHDEEDEFIKNFHKRGKFECTTCNKIFHSYQALGGHRASHKKTKGCFASKIEISENSIEFVETDLSHESKVMKISDNNIEYVQNMKIKGHHECPICFKVFQSGQALGGHKRSHMVAATGSESRVIVQVQEQVPQIRDFLDLNLPASTEEESNSHADSNRPWWIVEGNQQEALVG